MRTRWTYLPTLATLLALAACTDSGTSNQVAPTQSAHEGSAGPAPACVLGTWHATSTTASKTGNNFSGTLSGGEGVRLSIGADGATNVDFTSMRPVDFTLESGTNTVRGHYQYGGTASGRLEFTSKSGLSPAATPSKSPSTATPGATGSAGAHPVLGAWQPAGNANWDDLHVTLQLTSPVNQTLLNNVPVRNVNGNQTGQAGDVLDLRPVLRKGTYTCRDDTMTFRPQAKPVAVGWVFRRG